MRSLGLFRRREVWLPTARGLLVLLLLLAGAGAALLFGLHPFLAPNAPHDTGQLVVEGWISDEGIIEVLKEYRARNYSTLFATGQPIEQNSRVREYGSYANYGATRLREARLVEAVAVPSPASTRDRTYTSALALRDHLRHTGDPRQPITVLTSGPHARRSRLLFQKAFGDKVEIGVISQPSRDYDPKRWWRSSLGFREVVGETIAYLYARLLFSPAES